MSRVGGLGPDAARVSRAWVVCSVQFSSVYSQYVHSGVAFHDCTSIRGATKDKSTGKVDTYITCHTYILTPKHMRTHSGVIRSGRLRQEHALQIFPEVRLTEVQSQLIAGHYTTVT